MITIIIIIKMIIKIITIKNANSVLVINAFVALKKRYIDF